MKTFNKTYLPESITYNGFKYTLEQSCTNANGSKYDVMDLMSKGKKVIKVNVLSRNLRGKMDFFNRPYKPTIWLFTYQT